MTRRLAHILPICLAILTACGSEAERRVRFEDFVAHADRAQVAGAVSEPSTVYCGDETHFAYTLDDGAVLDVPLDLGRDPQLVLSGCLSHPSQDEDLETGVWRISAPVPGAAGSPAKVRWTVRQSTAPGGDEVTGELDATTDPGWWRRELDLGTWPEGAATLHLEVTLPAGRHLYLKDLYLEHQVVDPPAVAARDKEREEDPPQILLISVDTLRGDSLGVLGGRWSTPQLDRMAAEGEVWSPHYAAASWTKPSHASMLTGFPPEIYGGETGPLDPSVTTVAERLQAAGFHTRGLVHDCVWLNAKFGFGRGFDEYDATHWQVEKSVREAVDWIADHRHERFFFFFHAFEPHSDFHRLPYEAPGISRETVEREFGARDYGCVRRTCASGRLTRIEQGRMRTFPKDQEILRYLYGKGVEHVDEQIGLLLEHLRRLGIYDRMLIIFTADHGESLLEHGELLHGNYREEVLRVPLIVKWPGGAHAGERRDQVSSSLDLVPTILESQGLPHDDLPGSPLHQRRADAPVIAGTIWTMIRRGDLKAIYDPRDNTWQLFDLAADPGEEHDLAAERPHQVGEMGRLMQGFRQDFRDRLATARRHPHDGETGGITPEERERLRSLGYLGGT